jgi:hypothetical protein
MDPMIDLVRERTADLQRVAQGVRRERELRSAVVAQADVASAPTPAATAEPTGIPTAGPTDVAGSDRQAA